MRCVFLCNYHGGAVRFGVVSSYHGSVLSFIVLVLVMRSGALRYVLFLVRPLPIAEKNRSPQKCFL